MDTETRGEQILGFISAPTGAGRHYAQHGSQWGFRGRAPRWHATLRDATASVARVERAGRADGGRGRDAYIVAVVRRSDGLVEVRAGGGDGTGLAPGLTLGCSGHVQDAVLWLASRSARWHRAHRTTHAAAQVA